MSRCALTRATNPQQKAARDCSRAALPANATLGATRRNAYSGGLLAYDPSAFGITRLSKQIELHGRGSRRTEVLGRKLHLVLVEAEFLAGDFEPAADHPGVRA